MPDEMDDVILGNALGPSRVTGDSGSVEQHSLPDQIAADKYLGSKTKAALKPSQMLRRSKFVPPGAS